MLFPRGIVQLLRALNIKHLIVQPLRFQYFPECAFITYYYQFGVKLLSVFWFVETMLRTSEVRLFDFVTNSDKKCLEKQ